MSNYRTNYKTEEYYVAYLDFLGTRSFIEKDKENKYLNELNSICSSAIEFVNRINLFDKKETFIKIFSDNILIAEKLTGNPKLNRNNLERICSCCCAIQHNALKEGYLLRGAIVKGKFFHNKIFVYGQALVDAVNIEENIATYPRIVANQEIVKNASSYFFQDDTDGCFCLNMFMYSQDFDTIHYRNKLLENLQLNKENFKAIQKIRWLITKYNNYFSYRNKTLKIYHSFKSINNKEIEDAIK